MSAMGHTLTTAPIRVLAIPPEAPRTEYSTEGFRRLQESIAERGILVPLVVREAPGGGYHVIDGSTRLTAVRALEWDGDVEVPVYVVDGTDADAVAASVLINQLRERLSLHGELRGLRHLVNMGLTQAAAGEALGRNRQWASRMLKIDELPEDLKDAVAAGDISVSHGLIIAQYLDHPEVVAMLADLARSGNVSGAILKRMADEAVAVGTERARERRPQRHSIGARSWVRTEPLREGTRLEVHWNAADDPEDVVARVRELLAEQQVRSGVSVEQVS